MYLAEGSLLRGGTYKIVRHISSGGFGNTYEGIHTGLDARVAIKEFFPKMFCNREENSSHITVATAGNRELIFKLRQKFIEEAKAIFMMNHPHIIKVHDIFEDNGTAYYVMDYVEGSSLGQMVDQRGALPEDEAVIYIRQIAAALSYVHSHNRLHLDIKPGNIMVDNAGNAILIDFGASKHYDLDSGENTSTLMGLNTQGYAPVEQVTKSFTHFSPATDIYALGATLYKLLTGITPPDATLLIAQEVTLQPLPANISIPTRNAVMSAMALVRTDRLQDINAFMEVLQSEGTKYPQMGVADSPSEDTRPISATQSPQHVQTDMWWRNKGLTPVSFCNFFTKKWSMPAWMAWSYILIVTFFIGFMEWLFIAMFCADILHLSSLLELDYAPGIIAILLTIPTILVLYYLLRAQLFPSMIVRNRKELIPTDYIETKRHGKYAIVARGVGNNLRFGLYNMNTLRMVIPFKYDSMQWTDQNLLKVQLAGDAYFIDASERIFR